MVGGADRFRPVPFRLLKTADGVVLKRGTTEISILGGGAAEFVQTVVAAAAGGATREEIAQRFPAAERPVADQLVGQLIASRLLVTVGDGSRPVDDDAGESSLDVFYWQFDTSAADVTERLNRAGIVLVGVNAISRQLAQALFDSGVTALTVVDDRRLRDGRLFEARQARPEPFWPLAPASWVDAESWRSSAPPAVGCLVATSDYGNQTTLREWNAFCVARGHRYLPVFLQNFVGYVGPLVVPGETACFDCLRARWNADLDLQDTRRALDELAVDDQGVVGFHPAMASVLGDVAAFELTKLLGRGLPQRRIGVQIEVSLLASRLVTRRILKAPRCATCSPLRRAPAVSPWK